MFSIYRTLFKTVLAEQLQYRASLLIWLLGFTLEPTIFMVVWRTIALSHGGNVGTFAAPEVVLYFLGSMLINHLTFDWHFYEMEPRVRNGLFSPLLLRPIHPIHWDFADNVVYKMLTFPFMFAAATGLYFYFGPAYRPQLWAVALFVPALVMAFALRFLLEWTIALAALWTTRTQAINTTYIIVATFLSGRFTPLELLSPTFRHIAQILPFRLWISFPVELLLGRLTLDVALDNLAQQAIWVVIVFGLFQFVWYRGMKRYSAVGA